MITHYISPLEVTSQHRITEHVFNRFEIDASNTDMIVNNTALKEINPDFLVDVLNVFCNYKEIDIGIFSKYPVPVIVDYLERSHHYYVEKIIPEIGQSISILLNQYPKSHPLLNILHKFYFKYKVDLEVHFKEEEDNIFLYAKSLFKAVHYGKQLTFFMDFLKSNSINDFLDDHTDTVDYLSSIINILSDYGPPNANESAFRILQEKLKNFELDLNIHAFIEDKVLVILLLNLEQKLKLEINN